MTIQYKIIIGLVVVILLMAGAFVAYTKHRDEQIAAANNKLAELIPLQHANDSLAFKIAGMVPAEEIQKHLDKEAQLAKTIKDRDERILVLASAKTETSVPTFSVPIVHTIHAAGNFLKNDRWFSVSGWLDSADIHFENFATWDSLTFAITQSREGILYGYIANHSPYNKVLNADFVIDSKQYYKAPWFRWDGVGIVGSYGSPAAQFIGVDARAVFWDQFEITPRATVGSDGFRKSIEGRWRLPLFR
jgi:hypothetical protein